MAPIGGWPRASNATVLAFRKLAASRAWAVCLACAASACAAKATDMVATEAGLPSGDAAADSGASPGVGSDAAAVDEGVGVGSDAAIPNNGGGAADASTDFGNSPLCPPFAEPGAACDASASITCRYGAANCPLPCRCNVQAWVCIPPPCM